MQNIEFKAELRDIEAARAQCTAIGADHIRLLEQVDTYCKLPDGRLKKRECPGDPTEWIFYHRKDRTRPTMSTFTILSETEAEERWSASRIRPWLVVKKSRELWLVENVRIHLDVVEKLGTFIEFEALVSQHEDVEECHLKVNELCRTFAPVLGEPIAVGYADMLAEDATEVG